MDLALEAVEIPASLALDLLEREEHRPAIRVSRGVSRGDGESLGGRLRRSLGPFLLEDFPGDLVGSEALADPGAGAFAEPLGVTDIDDLRGLLAEVSRLDNRARRSRPLGGRRRGRLGGPGARGRCSPGGFVWHSRILLLEVRLGRPLVFDFDVELLAVRTFRSPRSDARVGAEGEDRYLHRGPSGRGIFVGGVPLSLCDSEFLDPITDRDVFPDLLVDVRLDLLGLCGRGKTNVPAEFSVLEGVVLENPDLDPVMSPELIVGEDREAVAEIRPIDGAFRMGEDLSPEPSLDRSFARDREPMDLPIALAVGPGFDFHYAAAIHDREFFRVFCHGLEVSSLRGVFRRIPPSRKVKRYYTWLPVPGGRTFRP